MTTSQRFGETIRRRFRKLNSDRDFIYEESEEETFLIRELSAFVEVVEAIAALAEEAHVLFAHLLACTLDDILKRLDFVADVVELR